jgi:hypothetical protein
MRTARRPLVLALPALLLLGLVVVLIVVGLSPKSSPGLTVRQLNAYQAAITPPLRDGGATVQEGMKPAINDLVTQHTVPPQAMVGEARDWVTSLQGNRKIVAAVHVPAALADAQRLFLTSLDRYIEAAQDFGIAAGNASSRREWLQKVYAAGTAGDQAYDDASGILQGWRHTLGLPSSPDFPGGGQ